ncbi:hypothetical protein HHX48_17855 [Salinimonas sp. HHU 13199]|uniref:Uncharacterized protein n=1 Tax=Salinimonas profundi TaxID=2729140 RepID=A0ABR8LT66_9ALTE|nr:hypothetical protein [Salinimonas profundi]MBD3587607.1 hypothetical protein [Salinimonas profundi]
MKKILAYSLLLISFIAHSNGYEFSPSKYGCAGIDKEIKLVNDRLRAGYTLREGERLKEELRELKHKRFSCRHAGFSVK